MATTVYEREIGGGDLMSQKPEELMLREESDLIHCNNLPAEETPVSSKRTKTNPGNDT